MTASWGRHGAASLIAAASLAWGQCTPNADTNVTVDPGRSDVQAPIHTSNWQAQTFTATGSGCFLLGQVTFNVKKGGNNQGQLTNLVVEIYNASGGIPALPTGLGGSATPLASASVLPSAISNSYTDLTVTFSTPPQISGGSQYALVVHQTGGTGQAYYQLGLDDGNPYSGGQFCKSAPGPAWDCPGGPGGGLDVRMSICVYACPATGCTLTQGYWKNHPGSWPVAGLTLGSVLYTQSQLLSILGEPVTGNGLVSLAHQLIAAKLNQAAGAPVPSVVATAIAAADAMIGSLVIPPVGGGYLHPSGTGTLTCTLDQYNNGCTPGGPGHCGEPKPCPSCS